ncbi:magnesium transporter CorA family protein [Phytohabitans sp. ZYX-F-186]|uniref:Magnesium transporter CorA family protein n=1 Tax=Phytohabitans maris TaxID=3071409 RepID=A0ABU0ZAL4_9ACTN|nr:magnesium transporter CorA family protein [Phytohabitans sp. ZYX-F-186]MDQ7904095.1 magnesium transporter CorA family protein [Phytohabitans sp. ZYX-F-186]
MNPPSCPTQTRLYEDGTVIAEGFPAGQAARKLAAHPRAVLWLDLDDPEMADLAAIAEPFHLHPLAIEDAAQDHEAPKLQRYPGHLFLNVYALDIAADGDRLRLTKHEISAFVTDRALITVRKSSIDTAPLVQRWDADAALTAAGGVSFLLYGLLAVVVEGQFAAALRLDSAMDAVEDALLEEGAAPRPVRMRGVALRKLVAAVRRPVAPMPDLVSQAMRTDEGHLIDERLQPYYRDVEEHARHTVDEVEHLRDRIEGVLQADLAEQGNVLNDTTRKLAAWAAVIAVPTALTGFFGQNLPYPGYMTAWGFVLSTAVIAASAAGLYVYLRKRGWL